MNALRKFMFPIHFYRFRNGKFIGLERAWLIMIIASLLAIFRVGYEGKHNLEAFAFWDILYAPFLAGVLYFSLVGLGKNLDLLPRLNVFDMKDHWRSQLAFLDKQSRKRSMTYKEEKLYDSLRMKWKTTYGISWADSKTHLIGRIAALIWFALMMLVALIYV